MTDCSEEVWRAAKSQGWQEGQNSTEAATAAAAETRGEKASTKEAWSSTCKAGIYIDTAMF